VPSLDLPGETEVEQHDLFPPAGAGNEEDVPGLHVAVDEARVMGGRQGSEEAGEDAPCLFRGERPHAIETGPEALAREELGHEVEQALRLPEVVDPQDPGVAQLPDEAQLAPQPFQGHPTGPREQDLQGDHLVGQLVPGAEDLPGPPVPDPRLDPVPAGEEGAFGEPLESQHGPRLPRFEGAGGIVGAGTGRSAGAGRHGLPFRVTGPF